MALEGLTTMDAADQAAFDAMRDAPAPAATPAPEPAPSAQPASVPAEPAPAQPAKDGDPQRPQTVPHAALHEERERRKEIERKAQENERKWEERFNALLQRVAQPQQAAQPANPDQPQIPDIATDPVGHFRARAEMMERRLAEIASVEQSRQQMGEQARQFQSVAEAAQVAERQFMATTPDYNDAALHLKNTRAQELAVMGFNPVEAERIISQEAMNIAQAAFQRRQNPAEIIYNLAKQRGYAGKVPAVPAATPAAPAAPAAPPSADGAQRLDRLEAGQEQAQSLSRTRGAAPAPLTAARLLEMSDDDFHKAISTPEGRALFGA